MRHLTTLFELTADDASNIFDRADDLKRRLRSGDRSSILPNRILTQIFDKPSLRTRLSFEVAMMQLGGSSSFFTARDAGMYGRESLPDIARVVSRLSDVVVLRTFSHTSVEEFRNWSSCPVINGLSDDYHPCQALTDMFTIREVIGRFDGRRLAYVGDGNNVASSLAIACGILGMSMIIASPPGYELPEDLMSRIRLFYPMADITQTSNPMVAVRDADIIYTDVWASMGQEEEAEVRKRDFSEFQVNSELLAHAPATCRFMHDLPARRGLEVTDEVMDGRQSIVFEQAENRMHLAKGLLTWILEV